MNKQRTSRINEYFLLLTIFLILYAYANICNVAEIPEKSPIFKGTIITMTRGACLGPCPNYTVTLHADGKVTYEGEFEVDIVGKYTYHVPRERVEQLIQEMYDIRFFSFKDVLPRMTDVPTTKTTIIIKGKRHSVYHPNLGPPKELVSVEEWIDEIAQTSRFIKTTPDTIKTLVQSGWDVNSKQKREQWTSLMCAAQKGNIDILIALLEAGAKTEVKSKNGRTALMFASMRGHVDIVKQLIKAGAKVNEKNRYGKTSLMFAAESGQTEVVRVLIKSGANIHAKDVNNKNALDYTTSYYKVYHETVQVLLDAGAKYH